MVFRGRSARERVKIAESGTPKKVDSIVTTTQAKVGSHVEMQRKLALITEKQTRLETIYNNYKYYRNQVLNCAKRDGDFPVWAYRDTPEGYTLDRDAVARHECRSSLIVYCDVGDGKKMRGAVHINLNGEKWIGNMLSL